MQTATNASFLDSISQGHGSNADGKEHLATFTGALSDLSLPRIDFNQLLQEQLLKAKELKSRVLAPPTIGDRFLSLIEGPWAPAAQDLPDRLDISVPKHELTAFRKPYKDSVDLSARSALKRQVASSENRWPLTRWSSVYEYDVPIQKLPSDLHGFTILHLSDIHFLKGCERPCEELSRVAKFLETGKRRIDLILLSGDVITRSPEDLNKEALRQLHRMSDVCSQSFMVYGNHDYHGHMPASISKQLEEVGFHDINNHHIRLKIGKASLNLIGVDDAYFGVPVAPKTVDKDAINIVLTHNLDAIRGNFPADIDLILSGHTHWGEVKIFDGSSLMRIWGYCDNINRHTKQWDVLSDRTLSFVHPGLARYYVPFRGLRHPPGVAIHSLYAASSAARL
jgi:predicted MPP superfamily phosphohydrolase